MLSQTRRMAVPSASLMMPATGAVWPTKNVAVAEASISGSEAQADLPSQPAFQIKLAMLAANAIMLTLNSICSGRNLLPDFGQHCTTVETQAIETASSALRFTTAISRNGRLTDMVPSMPGSLIFIFEVAAASVSMASAYAGCTACLASPAYTVPATAARAMPPMNAFVSRGFRCIFPPSLSDHTRLLLIVSGIRESPVGSRRRRAPHDACSLRARASARTPHHAKCAQQIVIPGQRCPPNHRAAAYVCTPDDRGSPNHRRSPYHRTGRDAAIPFNHGNHACRGVVNQRGRQRRAHGSRSEAGIDQSILHVQQTRTDRK